MKKINLKELEKKYGKIKFNNKDYWLVDQAEHGNSLLHGMANYKNPDEDGNYYFDMQCFAIDCNGIEYRITWIFNTEKDEDGNSKELDEYDYEDEYYIVEVKPLL
jgi:hypothetical protein